MTDLNLLLNTSWGAEKWIDEGWSNLTDDEKSLVTLRLNEMFKDGLPFDLIYDNTLYIYVFALLAQLEVIAIQVPLKFESCLENTDLKSKLRTQLIDEVFHGLVFTKIVFMLSSSLIMPPKYNSDIEILCDFIRNEECPKVAIILLNLLAEGLIEELFEVLYKYNIAPKVFRTILEDETRHVQEAELYAEIGTPNKSIIKKKLEEFENLLLNKIFLNFNYTISLGLLIGIEGVADITERLVNKHNYQLKQLNLKPSKTWELYMGLGGKIMPKIMYYGSTKHLVPFTPSKRFLMSNWTNPTDPTMTGEFNLNISRFKSIKKSHPEISINTIMLQAVSLSLTYDPNFRLHLQHNEIYRTEKSYVGVVVKLPECDDHLCTIILENCHEMTAWQVTEKIKYHIGIMMFCYKKRLQLEKENPQLEVQRTFTNIDSKDGGCYAAFLGNSVVSVSNIGSAGYSRGKTPLLRNEALKFLLLTPERKLVWNDLIEDFEAQDILPVSISADHRVFHGNIPVPKIIKESFDIVLNNMLKQDSSAKDPLKRLNNGNIFALETLVNANLELGYNILSLMQTIAFDFMALEEILEVIGINLLEDISLRGIN